jgi:Ca2+-binding EF-hand superfamily protein
MNTTVQRSIATGGAMLGGLLLAASAWAGGSLAAKFKTMDTNGDGMISASEHASGVTAMFTRMDTNRDGNVTAAEMDAGHKGDKGMHHDMSSADKIARMDTNGDGMLSPSEHDAGAKSKFAEMDSDKNGSLSMAEMDAGHAMMKTSGDH